MWKGTSAWASTCDTFSCLSTSFASILFGIWNLMDPPKFCFPKLQKISICSRVLLFDTYLSPTSTDRAKDTWDLTWGYVMSFREVISYTKENKGKTGPYAAAAQNGERSKRKDKQSKVSGCLMMVGLCASAKDTVPHLLLFPLERQPHLCREKRDTYLMVVIGAPKSVCSLSPICSFYIQPFHCHFPH